MTTPHIPYKYRRDIDPLEEVAIIIWGPNHLETAPKNEKKIYFDFLDALKERDEVIRTLRAELQRVKQQFEGR